MKILVGNICYPKSKALIIPANTKGSMLRGRSLKIRNDGLGGILKEAKKFTTQNKVEPGDCFSTGPGRLNRRGLKKIYHAVIKRLQSDFTSVHIVREALYNSLSLAVFEGMESITVCGLGIEPGELDPITVARVTLEQIKKFADKIEIKIIDDDQVFINELENLSKE